MAVADLNGDGVPDLVTANYDSNNVSVLLGNGNGTFQAAQPFAVGSGPSFVAIADLNGDGVPDLVTANAALQRRVGVAGQRRRHLPGGPARCRWDQTSICGRRRPQRRWHPRSRHRQSRLQQRVGVAGQWRLAPSRRPSPLLAGLASYFVAIADLNGDGVPDLVTANRDSNDVSVLLGTGAGTFQTARHFPAGNGPESVAVADLNGDGTPDLVTANRGSDTVSVLLHR